MAVSRVNKYGQNQYPVNNHKVSTGSTRERCEIGSKLTIETPEQRDVFLVCLLLILNIFHSLF